MVCMDVLMDYIQWRVRLIQSPSMLSSSMIIEFIVVHVTTPCLTYQNDECKTQPCVSHPLR